MRHRRALRALAAAAAIAAAPSAAAAQTAPLHVAYVLDTLMADLVGHDRQPSAFLVYLHLWRRTAGLSFGVTVS